MNRWDSCLGLFRQDTLQNEKTRLLVCLALLRRFPYSLIQETSHWATFNVFDLGDNFQGSTSSGCSTFWVWVALGESLLIQIPNPVCPVRVIATLNHLWRTYCLEVSVKNPSGYSPLVPAVFVYLMSMHIQDRSCHQKSGNCGFVNFGSLLFISAGRAGWIPVFKDMNVVGLSWLLQKYRGYFTKDLAISVSFSSANRFSI